VGLVEYHFNSRDAKGELNQCGGVKLLFDVLESHFQNDTITFLVLALLNQISSRTTTRVAIARQNAVHKIFQVLWTWEQKPKIQLMCLKTLDILCTLSSCRKRLVEEGRLSRLIVWLTEKSDERSFIEPGLAICLKLAISSGDSRRALQEAGGSTFFLDINTKYSSDQEFICQCLQCSSSMLEEADYEKESSGEEVFSSDAESSGDGYAEF